MCYRNFGIFAKIAFIFSIFSWLLRIFFGLENNHFTTIHIKTEIVRCYRRKNYIKKDRKHHRHFSHNSASLHNNIGIVYIEKERRYSHSHLYVLSKIFINMLFFYLFWNFFSARSVRKSALGIFLFLWRSNKVCEIIIIIIIPTNYLQK